MAQRYEICPVEELSPGERKIVDIDDGRHSIGVFNVDGEFYALANVCPHQLAPLCEGRITGEVVSESVGTFERIREGEVIQCPWHGWKFNIADGTSVFNPHELRTRTYDAEVEPAEEPGDGSRNETAENCAIETVSEPTLEGADPPVESYEVDVENEVVVVYV